MGKQQLGERGGEKSPSHGTVDSKRKRRRKKKRTCKVREEKGTPREGEDRVTATQPSNGVFLSVLSTKGLGTSDWNRLGSISSLDSKK